MNKKRIISTILSLLLVFTMCFPSFAQTTSVVIDELDESVEQNAQEIIEEVVEETTEEVVEETTEEAAEETAEEVVEETTEEVVEETTEEAVEETTEETVEETTEEVVEETTEETVEETTEEAVEETIEETVEETTEETVEETTEDAVEEEKAEFSAEQPADNSKEAFVIVQNSQYSANKDYISSGWILDNRGGPARKSQGGSYDVLQDISTEAGTALRRPFAKISEGEIVVETSLRISGNGVSMILRDDNGDTLYEIKFVESAWSILESDGNYIPCLPVSNISTDKTFKFRIYINFDNGTAKTFIDNVKVAESELLSDNAAQFAFETDKESKVHAIPQAINIYANHAFYETFSYFEPISVYGWEVLNAPVVTSGELVFSKNTMLSKEFDKQTGTTVFETMFILPENDSFNVYLTENSNNIVSLIAQRGKLKVNNVESYTLTKNMWYRLRVVVDAQKDTADVLLNGRSIRSFKLTSEISGIDGILLMAGSGTVKFDNMRLFAQPEFDDYVPTPVVSDDDYTVGINVCNIWINGSHYGWGCISGYTEPEPVSGYYDEASPESADWEIKYMVEHGIDFQAVCWYPGTNSGPVKPGRTQLHDGYMYAKYSDMLDYAIIWEASSSDFDSTQFRTHYVPYLIENYFKDPRYLVIENKPVLFVFNFTKLDCLGDDAAVKAEFDYLELEVKKLGFDGVLFIASSLGFNYNATATSGVGVKMGFDGSACYSRADGSGNSIEGNKKSNNDYGVQRDLAWLNAGYDTYSIPCANVGFDKMPWHKTRVPNITPQDFKTVLEWLRDDYDALYGSFQKKLPSWRKNLYMLSTWNEFGEGTYIYPSGPNGFGYLDAVRDVFTNLPSTHEDDVPTGAQKDRITHLYPQDLTYLRYQGYEEKGWHFEKDAEGWTSSLMTITPKDGVITIQNKSTKNENPNIYIEGLNIMSDLYKGFRVRVGNYEWNTSNSKDSNNIVIYYDSGSGYKTLAEKWYSTKTYDGFVEYYVPFTANLTNREIIQKLRFDPFNASGKMDIDFIQLVPKGDEGFTPLCDDVLYINDNLVENRLSATTNGTDVFFAYDPEFGMDFLLNSLVTWYRHEGKFIIESINHKVEFTVGSADYYVDGEKFTLESVIDLRNGLPMLPVKQLAEGLGFSYRVTDNKHNIYTDEYLTYLNVINVQPKDRWDFNEHYLGGWSSPYMRFITTDSGSVIIETNGTSTDPVILVQDINLDLSKYSAVKIGINNYSYHDSVNGEDKSSLSMFVYETPTSTAIQIGGKWLSGQTGGKQVVTFNLNSTLTVQKLRFDPFNALGTMELDYIEFVPKETVTYTAEAPTTMNVAQIRDVAPQGLRYAAYVEIAEELCEYGFIVARKDQLTDEDLLKINTKNPGYKGDMGTSISGRTKDGIKYVGAVAIRGGLNIIYSTTGGEFGNASLGDGLYFTTVLTGIEPAKYQTKFCARPYVKDAGGNYHYGEVITRSLYEVAKSIPAAERTDFVKSIISYVDDKDTFTDVGGLLKP